MSRSYWANGKEIASIAEFPCMSTISVRCSLQFFPFGFWSSRDHIQFARTTEAQGASGGEIALARALGSH